MNEIIPAHVISQRKLFRPAYIKLISAHGADYAVGLAFNREVTIRGARERFGALLAHIDSFYLGRKWAKFPSDERTLAFAVMEHVESNLHLHAVMNLPRDRPNRSVTNAETLIPAEWKKLVPAGSCDIKPITDLRGAASYMTKELNNPRNWDHFIISTEFHNS